MCIYKGHTFNINSCLSRTFNRHGSTGRGAQGARAPPKAGRKKQDNPELGAQVIHEGGTTHPPQFRGANLPLERGGHNPPEFRIYGQTSSIREVGGTRPPRIKGHTSSDESNKGDGDTSSQNLGAHVLPKFLGRGRGHSAFHN